MIESLNDIKFARLEWDNKNQQKKKKKHETFLKRKNKICSLNIHRLEGVLFSSRLIRRNDELADRRAKLTKPNDEIKEKNKAHS